MEEESDIDEFPLDTSKAERSLWLMKCPTVVSRSLQMPDSSNSTPPVAKVILSLDPLSSNDDESSPQVRKDLIPSLLLFLLLFSRILLLFLWMHLRFYGHMMKTWVSLFSIRLEPWIRLHAHFHFETSLIFFPVVVCVCMPFFLFLFSSLF